MTVEPFNIAAAQFAAEQIRDRIEGETPAETRERRRRVWASPAGRDRYLSDWDDAIRERRDRDPITELDRQIRRDYNDLQSLCVGTYASRVQVAAAHMLTEETVRASLELTQWAEPLPAPSFDHRVYGRPDWD